MKKFIFLLCLLPFLSNANPIWIGMQISEVRFNETGGWTLEINNQEADVLDYIDSLVLRSNSGSARIINYDINDFIIISNNNLDQSLDIDMNGDCIYLYSYSYGESNMDSICIGDLPSSYLNNIQAGQSIARRYYYGPFYKDNSPTIGIDNDFDGTKAKIYGHFYDTEGLAISNKYFFINEGYCSPIMQEQGESGFIAIDENGFYCAEITSRSYFLNQIRIYESSTNSEILPFQDISFSLNENDSINIDFSQLISAVKTLEQEKIIMTTYPNPARDIIYFVNSESQNKQETFQINIYDQSGKQIEAFKLESELFSWNCSHLEQGTYIYTLSTGHNVVASNKFQVVK